MVTGIPLLPKTKEICEPYILSKHQRMAIPKVSTSCTSRILEIVHSDLCGPLPHQSMTGSRYILTSIDDYSRRSWIYFLVVKSETFDTFKSFKSIVEKETNQKMSCLRTDRGGEYLTSDYNTFCKQQGIKRQLTTDGTPQQNGLAERKNRHLCETMRSLLFSARLPTFMWEETARTENYISNRTPHQALHRIIPLETFIGKVPDISHLRIFGCTSYIHIQS
jgi:transposase InsO family protein